MTRDDEVERLKRLRDRQIRLRDPGKVDRERYQRIKAQERPDARQVPLKQWLRDLESKWTWMVVGGLIGLLVGVVVDLLLADAWAAYVPYFTLAFGAVAGRVLGSIIDRGRDWRQR